MIRKDTLLAWPMIAFMVLFFLSPLLVLTWISLRVGAEGWGLGNFAAFLSDPFARGVLLRTLMLGAKVTFWVSHLSLPLVMLYWHGGRRLRGLILICALLPMLTANVVRTFAWVVILGPNGPISQTLLGLGLTERPFSMLFSEAGLIMALAQIELPLLLLPVFSVLNRAAALEEASATLAACRARAFLRISLSGIMQGIIAGAFLVFMQSLDNVSVTLFLGEPGRTMLPLRLFAMLEESLDGRVAAVSGLLILAAALLLITLLTQLRLAGISLPVGVGDKADGGVEGQIGGHAADPVRIQRQRPLGAQDRVKRHEAHEVEGQHCHRIGGPGHLALWVDASGAKQPPLDPGKRRNAAIDAPHPDGEPGGAADQDGEVEAIGNMSSSTLPQNRSGRSRAAPR